MGTLFCNEAMKWAPYFTYSSEMCTLDTYLLIINIRRLKYEPHFTQNSKIGEQI